MSNDRRPLSLSISPQLSNVELNELFTAAWNESEPTDFAKILDRSLVWIAAHQGTSLVGFVNVATDGGKHAFIIDTTVHPTMQRQGLGTRLVEEAAQQAKERGAHWLHVDYEAHLEAFYTQCGFTASKAGVRRL